MKMSILFYNEVFRTVPPYGVLDFYCHPKRIYFGDGRYLFEVHVGDVAGKTFNNIPDGYCD